MKIPFLSVLSAAALAALLASCNLISLGAKAEDPGTISVTVTNASESASSYTSAALFLGPMAEADWDYNGNGNWVSIYSFPYTFTPAFGNYTRSSEYWVEADCDYAYDVKIVDASGGGAHNVSLDPITPKISADFTSASAVSGGASQGAALSLTTPSAWYSDSIDAYSGFKWYSFPTTAGHRYFCYFDNADGWDGYTAASRVTVYDASGNRLIWSYQGLGGASSPLPFTAPSTGTVYVKVVSEWSAGGTYALAWAEHDATAIPATKLVPAKAPRLLSKKTK